MPPARSFAPTSPQRRNPQLISYPFRAIFPLRKPSSQNRSSVHLPLENALLSEDASPRNTNNPLIVIGDKIEAKTHLVALLQLLRTENGILPEEDQIQYAVCKDSTQVALALRRYLNTVKMILLGPDLIGNSITVARMLSKKAKIVVVIDPQKKPLSIDA